ncbi:MAG: RIP metalloprotease RseP [Agarilytica sp.]
MFEHFVTALWFLLAICILVPIHEFGHFYAMRIFGVKVLRFSVGFGRRLWTWTDSQGTEFAISAIPLGGYVKPLDERNEEVSPEELPNALGTKPEWQRIIIFFAGPFANFVLAILFYWLILLVKGTTSYSPVIGHVEPNSIAAHAGLAEGQEIVAVDGEPTPTRKAVTLHLLSRLGETGEIRFTSKYSDTELSYESEGILDNWLSDEKSPNPLKGLGIEFYYPALGKVLDKVLEGSPAEHAGFQSGDELLSLNGEDILSWESWVKHIRKHPNVAMDVEVLRGGEEIPLKLTPESLTLDSGEVIGRAGVSVVLPKLPEEMVRVHRYNIVSALSSSLTETMDTSVFILLSMKKLIFGEISSKNLSGPIGIAKVAASHAELGFWAFLSFLAHLSIVLGVMNLLPVPILDGGHIVFAVIEWVKGSPVSQEVQVWSLNVGIVMLFGVMMIAFYNDILGA